MIYLYLLLTSLAYSQMPQYQYQSSYQQPQQMSYQPVQYDNSKYQNPMPQSQYPSDQSQAAYQSYSSQNYNEVYYLAQEYRSINGYGNNILYPEWGAAWWPFARHGGWCWYQTTHSRDVSNLIGQSHKHAYAQGESAMVQAFGNLLVHDLSLIKAGKPAEPFPITIYNEPKFCDQIDMYRTNWIMSPYGYPDQINGVTSYLDLSPIYGSDKYVTDKIRAFYNGYLLSDPLTGVPHMDISIPLQGDPTQNYPCGDERCNENPGLLSLTGLFVINHNYICDELLKVFPQLDDERLFEEARRRNVAIYQHIIYDEFLPQGLGLDLGPYEGYNPYINPTVMNEFSVIAGRYYHSGLPAMYHRLNNDMSHHSAGYIDIHTFAFQGYNMLDNYGITPIIMGLVWYPSEEQDITYVEALRTDNVHNFDLLSMDIWRSEDHGVSAYNCIRQNYGLAPYEYFEQVNPDPEIYNKLYALYGHPDYCHSLICANAEVPWIPGYDLGELHTVISYDQYKRLRDGDRFWYENQFCFKELIQIQSKTFANLIKELLNVNIVPVYVFQHAPSYYDLFLGMHYDCSQEYVKFSYEYSLPIQAYFDNYEWRCVCPDPYSYFKVYINQCYCIHGYVWDPTQYKCILDESFDYGEYKQYHKPSYNLAYLSNSNYNNYMGANYYTQTSDMSQAYNIRNY